MTSGMVQRLVERCDTEVLKRVLADPIKAKDPEQAAENSETMRHIKAELARREALETK